MSHIKENHFTKDVFFREEKKAKAREKAKADPINQPSKNFGSSRGSSQNIVGTDYMYRGDLVINKKTTAEALIDYIETLPYLMPGMEIVLKEKLEEWHPKGKSAESQVKKIRSMIKWETEKLIEELKAWKKT